LPLKRKVAETLIAFANYDQLIQILNSKKTNDTLIIEKELSDYPELTNKEIRQKSEVLFNNNSSNSRKSNATIGRSCHHSQINRKIDVYLKDSLAIKATLYTIKICRYKELKT
jgi:hypothetical protein